MQTRQRNRLTRLGFHFLFVGSFAMIGGALRGFNLLLVLAGLVVGILLMHWRWSRRSLEDVTVDRRLPREAFAGKPFRVGYLIRSNRRFLPVWMLRIEDVISSQFVADPAGGKWNRWRQKPESHAKAVCGVGVVPLGKSRPAHFDCTIFKRGVYELGPATLVSCFPFSLITASKKTTATQTLHVYPALLPLRPTWSRKFTSLIGGETSSVKRNGGGSGEFFGLREWRSGDSTQLIHWRTTARTGIPAVRQFEQKRNFDVCLLLDAFSGSSRKPEDALAGEDSTFEQAPFERAASLVATLLCRMQEAATNRFVLTVAGLETSTFQSNGQRGSAELTKRRMFELLAATESVASPKLCHAIEATMRLVGRSQEMVVISTRSKEDAVLNNPELKEALAGWNRANGLRWIDVRSSDFDEFVMADRQPKPHRGAAQ